MHPHRKLLPLALFLLLILAACGGGEEPAPAAADIEPAATSAPAAEPTDVPPEPIDEPVAEPTEEVAAETSSGIASFSDAVQATIQIEAQGSFMDPDFGLQLNSGGRGSGFIIDPSGIAVTNNHVVTGAAFLQVWVGGDANPLNARVLGVSECSDLAVIDIDGDGYPYLEWVASPVTLGTDVYTIGFPLGDPRPTITRGIISKEAAGGETNWASLDEVLEHDATINPGNSGGPLVNSDGQVVGINYRGYDEASQYFAISSERALQILDQLQAGEDVNSIGVNGEAVSDGADLSGIWVTSVESGSPADTAGIQPGDIITKMEGLVLATDGSMADYCDILRSNQPDDTMSIEVLRFETDEVLEGQLNGRPLETSISFAQVVDEEVGGLDQPADSSPQDYVEISDDSGSMIMQVPVAWSDVDGQPWTDDEGILGGSLVASPSIAGFDGTYTTPGVQMWASNFLSGDMNGLLDLFDYSADCGYDGRYTYEDPIYTGSYDLYIDCAGEGSVIILVAAQPEDASHAVILLAQAVTESDLDAIDNVLDTFNVVGTLPSQ